MELSSSSTDLSKDYHVILPTLNGHGEEYQPIMFLRKILLWRFLDYVKANCGGKLFAIGGVSLEVKLPWSFCH